MHPTTRDALRCAAHDDAGSVIDLAAVRDSGPDERGRVKAEHRHRSA